MARLGFIADKPFSAFDRCKISKRTFAAAILALDSLLVFVIIAKVPYTKIDWDAYMSQVEGFLGGERDYTKLEGDTGPLVYPAGFLYIYSAVKFLTGGQVFPAQILFGILYIFNLGIVLSIYIEADVLPWWALGILCLSKRVHSIFVLRLFNDCFAMVLLHATIALVIHHRWFIALLAFSGAVSVKMNVLLFAPPLFLLMVKELSIKEVFVALFGAALLQILLGLPFLLSHPIGYISRAFNLGRVFIHFWSVNFKFVPEEVFLSKAFAVALLFLHLVLLLMFAQFKWSKHEGGLLQLVRLKFCLTKSHDSSPRSCKPRTKFLSEDHVATVMFVGNFIGVVFARSLHYQFYSWYFYSLPYLLWKTPFHTLTRFILLAGVEICWNVYPSNFYSSLLLLSMHLCILWGLWIAPSEYPYTHQEHARNKEE